MCLVSLVHVYSKVASKQKAIIETSLEAIAAVSYAFPLFMTAFKGMTLLFLFYKSVIPQDVSPSQFTFMKMLLQCCNKDCSPREYVYPASLPFNV